MELINLRTAYFNFLNMQEQEREMKSEIEYVAMRLHRYSQLTATNFVCSEHCTQVIYTNIRTHVIHSA